MASQEFRVPVELWRRVWIPCKNTGEFRPVGRGGGPNGRGNRNIWSETDHDFLAPSSFMVRLLFNYHNVDCVAYPYQCTLLSVVSRTPMTICENHARKMRTFFTRRLEPKTRSSYTTSSGPTLSETLSSKTLQVSSRLNSAKLLDSNSSAEQN